MNAKKECLELYLEKCEHGVHKPIENNIWRMHDGQWAKCCWEYKKEDFKLVADLETESWVICHIGGVVRREVKQELSEDRMRLQAKLPQAWETFCPKHQAQIEKAFFDTIKRYSQDFHFIWYF